MASGHRLSAQVHRRVGLQAGGDGARSRLDGAQRHVVDEFTGGVGVIARVGRQRHRRGLAAAAEHHAAGRSQVHLACTLRGHDTIFEVDVAILSAGAGGRQVQRGGATLSRALRAAGVAQAERAGGHAVGRTTALFELGRVQRERLLDGQALPALQLNAPEGPQGQAIDLRELCQQGAAHLQRRSLPWCRGHICVAQHHAVCAQRQAVCLQAAGFVQGRAAGAFNHHGAALEHSARAHAHVTSRSVDERAFGADATGLHLGVAADAHQGAIALRRAVFGHEAGLVGFGRTQRRPGVDRHLRGARQDDVVQGQRVAGVIGQRHLLGLHVDQPGAVRSLARTQAADQQRVHTGAIELGHVQQQRVFRGHLSVAQGATHLDLAGRDVELATTPASQAIEGEVSLQVDLLCGDVEGARVHGPASRRHALPRGLGVDQVVEGGGLDLAEAQGLLAVDHLEGGRGRRQGAARAPHGGPHAHGAGGQGQGVTEVQRRGGAGAAHQVTTSQQRITCRQDGVGARRDGATFTKGDGARGRGVEHAAVQARSGQHASIHPTQALDAGHHSKGAAFVGAMEDVGRAAWAWHELPGQQVAAGRQVHLRTRFNRQLAAFGVERHRLGGRCGDGHAVELPIGAGFGGGAIRHRQARARDRQVGVLGQGDVLGLERDLPEGSAHHAVHRDVVGRQREAATCGQRLRCRAVAASDGQAVAIGGHAAELHAEVGGRGDVDLVGVQRDLGGAGVQAAGVARLADGVKADLVTRLQGQLVDALGHLVTGQVHHGTTEGDAALPTRGHALRADDLVGVGARQATCRGQHGLAVSSCSQDGRVERHVALHRQVHLAHGGNLVVGLELEVGEAACLDHVGRDHDLAFGVEDLGLDATDQHVLEATGCHCLLDLHSCQGSLGAAAVGDADAERAPLCTRAACFGLVAARQRGPLSAHIDGDAAAIRRHGGALNTHLPLAVLCSDIDRVLRAIGQQSGLLDHLAARVLNALEHQRCGRDQGAGRQDLDAAAVKHRAKPLLTRVGGRQHRRTGDVQQGVGAKSVSTLVPQVHIRQGGANGQLRGDAAPRCTHGAVHFELLPTGQRDAAARAHVKLRAGLEVQVPVFVIGLP